MKLDAPRWARVQELFTELVDASMSDRTRRMTWLHDAEPEVATEVARLLAADGDHGSWLYTIGDSHPVVRAGPGPSGPDPFGLSGRRIGHYEVEQPIGAGGMGVVFRARDIRLRRTVALKFLLPQYSIDAEARRRFEEEARAAAALEHPNICAIHEVGEDLDGRLFLAMPLYDGETLRSRLGGGALPVALAVDIALQAARGLACAHAHRIIHRDLSAGNLMLTSDGLVKILDFGLAHVADESRSESLVRAGTVGYMAPEQVRGELADPRTDLWALGVVMYEMLCGTRPFTGSSEVSVAHAILGSIPPAADELRPGIPPLLGRLVAACLEKEMASRPRSAAEMVTLLEGIATSMVAPSRGHEITRSSTPGVTRVVLAYAIVSAVAILLARLIVYRVGVPVWVVSGVMASAVAGVPLLLVAVVAIRRGEGLGRGEHVLPPPEGRMRRFLWRANNVSPRAAQRWLVTGGATAITALTVSTVGYMWMRVGGVGPPGSLTAAGVLDASDRLVVADFLSPGDSSLGRDVSAALRADLAQSLHLRIVDRSELVPVLQRMGRSRISPIDDQTAQEISRREGLKAYIGGEVVRLGPSYVLAARIYAARTDKVLGTVRSSADNHDELIGAISRLARAIRAKTGESLRTVNVSPPLEQVTTPSFEALRHYTAAWDLSYAGDSAREEVIGLLQEAVRIDTGFAMAYRKLGVELGNDGRARSQVQAAFKNAYENRERLTGAELYLTIASYYQFGPAHDSPKAIAAYKAVLAIDSNNLAALNNLGLRYHASGMYAEAERVLTRLVRLANAPQVGMFNLMRAQAALGDLGAASMTLDAMERRFPGARNTLDRAQLAALGGHVDSAEALVISLHRANPGHSGALRQLSLFAALRGRGQESVRYHGRTAELNRRSGARMALLSTSVHEANVYSRLYQDFAAARRILQVAIATYPLDSVTPADRPYFALSLALAGAGDARGAREMAARHAEAHRGTTSFFTATATRRMEAEIALAEGAHRRAIDQFRGPTDGECRACVLPRLAEAYDHLGQRDSAIAILKRLAALTDHGTLEVRAFSLARAHKRLGELLEARGDTSEALVHYSQFVSLWARAEPRLQPEVDRVRRQIAQLQRREWAGGTRRKRDQAGDVVRLWRGTRPVTFLGASAGPERARLMEVPN